MVFQARTYSVLLVSASEKFNTVTASLLPATDYWPVTTVKSVSEARRRISRTAYDIVIINAPLPDDFGVKLAEDACLNSEAAVLLLVKNDLFDEMSYRMISFGAVTFPKPTNTAAMTQALLVLRAMRERLLRSEKKQLSVAAKMEELRYINHAKWLLIENLSMTEEDAHRYLLKTSMDRRITKREAAEIVIRTYDKA